ncbi:MAG: hypothetical protein HY815_14875 [Candidatus Riflebacteria bacterium]|nr:hypothetical protein [Candidatus Riflebacteria bacterium]
MSHVTCWNRLGHCPGAGCSNDGAIPQPSTTALRGVVVCPYCREALPAPGVVQCPHCQEYIDQRQLQAYLQGERYSRCPGGIKALSVWMKIQGGMMLTVGVTALFALLADSRGGGSAQMAVGFMVAFFALLGVGFWRVGTGLREGRISSRNWARALFWLQIVSLRGLIVGVICLLALESTAAKAYFVEGQNRLPES